MQKDKILHVAAGFAVGIVASFLSVFVGMQKDTSVLVGLGLAALAGVGKEFYDRKHPKTNTDDVADAWHTVGGGAIGSIVGALLLPFIL